MMLLKKLIYATKISTKLIFFFLFLFSIWMITVYFGSYIPSKNAIARHVRNSMHQAANNVLRTVEQHFEQMEMISVYVFSNKVLQRTIIDGALVMDPIGQFDSYRYMQKILEGLVFNASAYEIRIYLPYSNLITAEGRVFFSEREISTADWYPRVVSSDGRGIWNGKAEKWGTSLGVEEAVSFVRSLKDTEFGAGNRLGVLGVAFSKDLLLKTLRAGQFAPGSECFLFDDSFRLVSGTSADSQAISETVSRLMGADRDISFVDFLNPRSRARNILVKSVIPRNGWHLVVTVPYAYATQESDAVFLRMLFLLAALFCLSVALTRLYSARMAGRILKIGNLIDDIQNKNFSRQISIKHDDELGGLERRFNTLIERISLLLDEVGKEEQRRRKAELAALQAQINPHFLYNTLDSINWMAVNVGEMDISRSVTKLGKFLRMGIGNGAETVSMAEELEHTALYVEIQNIRLGGIIDLHQDIDPLCMDQRIIKLTFQPFVENSILHGFVNAGRTKGSIAIRARISRGRVRVLIRDDGLGFDFDGLGYPEPSGRRGSGIGISNIRERMHFRFGAEAVLSVRSTRGQGTRVYLSWPADH